MRVPGQRQRWWQWGAIALLAVGRPLAAQRPIDLAPLRALHDSLAGIEGEALLAEMLRDARAIADRQRDDPEEELRLGLIALRLGELSGETRYLNLAGRTFAGITEDRPDLTLGWYGLARTDLDQSDHSLSFGMASMFGLDPAKGIVQEFMRSSGADSSNLFGVLQLAHRALRSRDDLDEEIGLRTLRLLPARAMARDAELALVRARLERETGDKDSATAVAERAARLHPDDAGVLRAQAQMRFVVGRSDGAGPWYRGLVRAKGEALVRYRRDLQIVIPDSVLASFDTVRAADRDTVIRAYWASQDPDGLPTADDRLAEHYRRLEFARHHYVRTTLVHTHPVFELDTLGTEAFDARGETILRHGSPDERTAIGQGGGPEVKVTLHVIGMPPNESWAYHDTHDGDRFYHFVAANRDSDFVAVTSLLDILALSSQFQRFRPGDDPSQAVTKTWGAELVSALAQELLRSRQDMSPLYTRMLNEGMGGADSLQAREREIGRLALLKPYSYELGFELPINGAIDILAVGSDRRGPLVQIAFAVPGDDLTPERLRTGAMAYPVRMRVAVVNTAGTTVMQVDTVRGFVTAQRLANGQYLLGQLPLRVPPGTYRIRASLEEGRRGMLSRPVTVHVPAPAGHALALSDVSLGVRSVRIPWAASAADTAWANPLRRFPLDEPMQLYVEVNGLDAGTEYETAVAIDRLDALPETGTSCGGSGAMLSLATRATAGGGIERVSRAVALDPLRPGEYQLTITVRADGAVASRCRNFTVVKP